MTQEQMAQVMEAVFDECRSLRGAGQKEYAHRNENSFANFERVAERLEESREKVLLTYMEKHLDGIHSWVKGHRSQREDVRGRINDAIVYLCLLRGMVEESPKKIKPVAEERSPLTDLFDELGDKIGEVSDYGGSIMTKPKPGEYFGGAPFPASMGGFVDGAPYPEWLKNAPPEALAPFVTGLQEMKERRPIILLDVDGVVADLLPAWLAAWNKDQPSIKNVAVEDITEWELGKICPGIFDYLTAELYDSVQPIAGSQAGVKELRELGRVVFVTSIARDTSRAKFDWLVRHGFVKDQHGWADDLYMGRGKDLIIGDIMVDDYHKNLEKSSVLPVGRILYSYPYNEKEGADIAYRARNWDELLDTVGHVLSCRQAQYVPSDSR